MFSERLLERKRGMDLLEAILNARYTDAEWQSRAREEHGLVDAWDEHKRGKHRKRRPRRPLLGMLLLVRFTNWEIHPLLGFEFVPLATRARLIVMRVGKSGMI